MHGSLLAGASLCLLALLAGAVRASDATRPNIIVVHVDSLDGRVLYDLEGPARMPNLRNFMKKSVTFTNTYSAAPECVPSRSAFWSGRRVDQTKTWNNGMGLDIHYPILMTQVHDARGYDGQFIGRRDFNYLGNSFNPPYAEEAAGLHHTLTANLSSWLRAVPGLNIPNEDRQDFLVVPDMNLTQPHFVDWARASEAKSWLQNRTASGDETPFFLSVGFLTPHPPYITSSYWTTKGVNESKVTVPQWKPLDELDYAARYSLDTKDVTWWPNMTETWWTDDRKRGIRTTYDAMAAEADGFVGETLAAIEAFAPENTYVFFWSDHGDGQMLDNGEWYKESTKEWASRVPLIVYGPGVRGNTTVDRPTSLLDVFPTVLDLTGTPYPTAEYAPAGYSLVADLFPAGGGPTPGTPEHPGYVLTQWHGDHGNTGQFAIRSGEWKLIYHAPFNATHGAMTHLYNLTADPNEEADVSALFPSIVSQLVSTMTNELGDMDSIDREAKSWDKAIFRAWKASLGSEANYEQTMNGSSLRWHDAWVTNPSLWLSLIADWENSPDYPEMASVRAHLATHPPSFPSPSTQFPIYPLDAAVRDAQRDGLSHPFLHPLRTPKPPPGPLANAWGPM